MKFMRFLRVCAAIILIASFVWRQPAATASVLTTATYSLSRHQVSTAANHDVRFYTPTGVDAPTDTITLTLSSGFSLASIDSGDVSLFYGATPNSLAIATLAASPAVDVWGLTVGSSSLTLTAPTNAGSGLIPANGYIVLKIGTNVSGGVHQITNPSTAQMAHMVLGGSFGDSAVLDVPITSASMAVSVTATVAATSSGGGGSGGGGGGGGAGDTVAPTISNVQAISITSSTASVIWNTDESATSLLEYGITIAYGSGTVSDGGYVTSHQLDLTQLSPNTTYHFYVSSSDTSANQAWSTDYTFTTLGDTQPPIISNIVVSNITDTSADIQWLTDEPTSFVLQYGTSTSYGLTVTDSNFAPTHVVALTGLLPATTYHFYIIALDAAGNNAVSADTLFTTLADQTPPANVSSFTAVGGDATVTLQWTLPVDPDFSGTRIVRRTDTYPTGPNDGTIVYEGGATTTTDAPVTNGIVYYYGAFAFDASGNFASGALAQAQPVGPPPIIVENTPALCSNGIDDDSDGLMDCKDPECIGLPICAPPPKPVQENTNASCSNGVDDDADGAIDCADPDCAAFPVCQNPLPQPTPVPLPVPSLVPSVPSSTPSGIAIEIAPRFFSAGGTIELVPDASGEFGAAVGSTVSVSVPVSYLPATPDKGYVTVDNFSYNLLPSVDGKTFDGSFITPGVGKHTVVVSMTFKEGGAAVRPFTLIAQIGGRVVEEGLLGKTDVAISGAKVTLYVDHGGVWEVWNGPLTGQANPQLSNSNGGFLFTVPNGRYYADVEAPGYRRFVGVPRFISKGVFGETIGLVAVPPPLLGVVSSTRPTIQSVTTLVENVGQQVVSQVIEVRKILQSPVVQEAVQTTVSPALLSIAVVNLATSLPLFNALAYLQYLFTQPILLFGRRKRRKWGTVYDALTKQPIELAIIRLLRADTHVVFQTRVSDKFGRYSFAPPAGQYILEVVKPGYRFPTEYLKEKSTDVDFVSLYHGRALDVQEGGMVIENIPLDPIAPEVTPRSVMLRKTWRAIQSNVAIVTIIASLIGLAIVPSVQVACIAAAQIIVYIFFRRLAAPKVIKNWGKVFEASSKKPLSKVVVRIFDKKFNKLLETQITEAGGTYGFFVRRNVYYVTAEKDGFQKHVSPDIDLSAKDEALIDQNISMLKK